MIEILDSLNKNNVHVKERERTNQEDSVQKTEEVQQKGWKVKKSSRK